MEDLLAYQRKQGNRGPLPGPVQVPARKVTSKKPSKYAPYRSKAEQTVAGILEAQSSGEDYGRWWYEPFSINLSPAQGCLRGMKYTPDFVVKRIHDMTMIEVKGPYCREDAVIKLKAAAQIIKDLGWWFELWIVDGVKIEKKTIV